MKKLFFCLLITAASIQSKANVADRFRCVLEVQDTTTMATAKHQSLPSVERIPQNAGALWNVEMTSGQTIADVLLQTEDAEFSAHLNFSFQHTLNLNPLDASLTAQQYTCVSLVGSYCSKDGSEVGNCTQTYSNCQQDKNPFDLLANWQPTRVVDGIPAFLKSTLSPVRLPLTDARGKVQGLVFLDCQHLETVR